MSSMILNVVQLLKQHAGFSVAVALAAVYTTYYISKIRNNKIHFNVKSHFAQNVMNECNETFNSTFYPTALFPPSGHLQTILGTVVRRLFKNKYRREIIKTKDGAEIGIDWKIEENEATNRIHKEDTTPTIIVLHGLAGSSSSYYVAQFVSHISNMTNGKWRSVVLNARGCGDTTLKTPQMFSAAWTEDVRTVINHVTSLLPNAPVMAVGFSLGGNILTKYLGEEGSSTPLTAAVSVANPFDLIAASKIMRIFYSKHLVKGLLEYFNRNIEQFSKIPQIDLERARNSKTVGEFDREVVIKVFGYKTPHDYYVDASSKRFVKDIQIPYLALNSMDDPVSPHIAVPVDLVNENENLFFLLTHSGGHLGWIGGLNFWSNSVWSDEATLAFLQAVLKSTNKLKE